MQNTERCNLAVEDEIFLYTTINDSGLILMVFESRCGSWKVNFSANLANSLHFSLNCAGMKQIQNPYKTLASTRLFGFVQL